MEICVYTEYQLNLRHAIVDRETHPAWHNRGYCRVQERGTGPAAARSRRRGAGGDDPGGDRIHHSADPAGPVRQPGAYRSPGPRSRSRHGTYRTRPLGRLGGHRAGHGELYCAPRQRPGRRPVIDPVPGDCRAAAGCAGDEPGRCGRTRPRRRTLPVCRPGE